MKKLNMYVTKIIIKNKVKTTSQISCVQSGSPGILLLLILRNLGIFCKYTCIHIHVLTAPPIGFYLDLQGYINYIIIIILTLHARGSLA